MWWNVSWRSLGGVHRGRHRSDAAPDGGDESHGAFKGSALGGLGALLTALLSLANIAVTLLATGWAMSRVALAQSGDFFDRVPASMQYPRSVRP